MKHKLSHIFVTGISTEVGKTLASSILVEALEADYWKPIQAGELDNSDSHTIHKLIQNSKTKIHPSNYQLTQPLSPHAAAEIDQVEINLTLIKRPKTKNHLVIEGAGGLMVPLNEVDTIANLIQPHDKIIVVSRHYLGSINHTLLTVEALKNRGFRPVLLFSGKEHKTTESIIKSKSLCKVIGRIDEEPYFDSNVISYYAEKFSENIRKHLL